MTKPTQYILLLILILINQFSIAEKTPINEMSIFQLPSVWINQNNQSLELKDLQGNVLVVVMIYTSCQAACPKLVAHMKNIYDQVSSKTKKEIKYLLVSIDPDTDTPEHLKEFAKKNNMLSDNWLFLTGSKENIRVFANVMGTKYKKISPLEFSHSNIISIFDDKGVLQYQQEGLHSDNSNTVKKIMELVMP